jgi:hypothetical protein
MFFTLRSGVNYYQNISKSRLKFVTILHTNGEFLLFEKKKIAF